MKNENVVLITGCSTGIGRELCEVLMDQGYTVIATARNIETLKDLRASLRLPLDVTQKETIRSAVDEILARFHRIDVLVNNAGYAIRGALEEISEESIKKLFDVNVFGVTNMINVVVPEMRRQRSGKIINIGSVSGKFSQPANGAYCASKHALEALSDALRLELYDYDIQVSILELGPVHTHFAQTACDHSHDLITNANSCYSDLYAAHLNMKSRQKETDAPTVARTIAGIIAQKRLKARYEVAVPYPTRMIMRFCDPLKEYLLRKGHNIGNTPRPTSSR